MEILGIVPHHVRRIPFGVHGDEDRLEFLGDVFRQQIDRIGNVQKFGRTDIGAEGKAEIDQHGPAGEIRFRHGVAGAVDQCERPANARLADNSGGALAAIDDTVGEHANRDGGDGRKRR